MYFFWCHSQLNLCFQNRYKLESAWWSSRQLGYLNVCGHSSPHFIFRCSRFIFSLALQHQLNLQWFSDLCSLLYLIYLDSWILHKNVACPYFQQFLHCGTLEFMLAPLIVAIYLPMLKHQLIKLLALLLLWTSQMSIQMIDMSDFGNTLMTHGLEASVMLLKIWFCLILSSTSLDVSWSWELP